MAQRKKRKDKGTGGVRMLPVLHPDAAGIDVGAEEVFVAVPPDRAAEPVRSFETFTRDLHEMADWLAVLRSPDCGNGVHRRVTGSPLFQILETRGFEVFLVNAQHVRNVPGRKSDVSDCQWIQYLHAVGLLKASFRPPDQICVVRSLWRHRESLVQMAAEHTMHMQKALSQFWIAVGGSQEAEANTCGSSGSMAIPSGTSATRRTSGQHALRPSPHRRYHLSS